jgi:hypothetical protein
MRHQNATQHSPGGNASHSRREGLRWRGWRRPLRRARRAIAATLGRVEQAGRVIDAAARFGRQRPLAATDRYVHVAARLAGAGTTLELAARSLSETTDWIALAGVPAGAPELLVETTTLWIAVAARLADTSNRMDAAFGQLLRDVQAGAVLPEPIVDASRPAEAGRYTILRTQSTSAARSLAAARKVSRGRAPPSLFACSL